MPPETSPHTRGEQKSRLKKPRSSRNIPAYAGRTHTAQRSAPTLRKHPRIRGENLGLRSVARKIRETSPHTRGELVSRKILVIRLRNIPAYAGRTENVTLPAPYSRKHPRIRGENTRRRFKRTLAIETSPHTRGEPKRLLIKFKKRRNIPAYAGRTIMILKVFSVFEKHPRIRGENWTLYRDRPWVSETSPHTRGELKRFSVNFVSPGNIPAYAGRTPSYECE